MDSVFVVKTGDLPRAKVGGVDDPSVRWAGAFAAYGGHGATASSTIVYEIEPGGRLGWHTDATEETQYILAGIRPDCLPALGTTAGPSCGDVLFAARKKE